MIKTKTFQSTAAMQNFCNGGIEGAEPKGSFDLAGKTLTFDVPAGAVTFANPTGGYALNLQAIQAQIQAVPALAGVRVMAIDGALAICEAVPTTGIKLSTAEDARAVLGLPRTGTIEGKVMKSQESPYGPRLVSVEKVDKFWVVVYDDANNPYSLSSSSKSTSIANPSALQTALSPPARAIYVGGDGNLVVHKVGHGPGVKTTYTGVTAGQVISAVVDIVYTDTTATLLVCEE